MIDFNRIAYQIDALTDEEETQQSSNAPITRAVWSCNDLPTGLSLSASGLLTGRPTVSGSYESHIQLATNWGTATKTISFTIV